MEKDRFSGPLVGGRFRLGPRINTGGQGRTFLARDEKAPGERLVVVKEHKLGESGWKKFELFEREARVLKQLSHPGIPKVVAHLEGEQGTFYLVLEKAPGATLKAIATRARFTEAELRDVMRQVLEILAYLHDLRPPVIHRDLKPANLVRDASGRIALVDFGGVKEALRDEGGTTVVGTFGYMAPEQLHGAAGATTDLYGLGATIVALAGGVEPEKVPRRGLRMDLRKHLGGMSRDLVDLLECMTDPDPEARPASAKGALAALAGKALVGPIKPSRAIAPNRSGASGASGGASGASERKSVERERGPEPEEEAEAEPEREPEDVARMPWPIRMFVRLAFVTVGTVGYIGVSVLELALVPLVFALLAVFAKDETKPRLTSTKEGLQGALGVGRRGFRDMQRRGLRGRKRRPALPPRRS